MATGPIKFKVEVKPNAADVLEYVELYVPGCGHQRMNLTPEEARAVCRLLFEKGYGPEDHALVTLQRYEHLLMAECGQPKHCDYKAGKVARVELNAPSYSPAMCEEDRRVLRQSLRDELIPVLQDYVDEELAKQNSATVEHVNKQVRAEREGMGSYMEQRLAEAAEKLGRRLDDDMMREVASAHRFAPWAQNYREMEKRVNFATMYGTTTAAMGSSLNMEDIQKAAALLDAATPVDGEYKRRFGRQLTYDGRTDNWVTKDNKPWLCHRAMLEYFGDLVKGAKVLRLVDYNYKPGAKTVSVQYVKKGGHLVQANALVDGTERELYRPLAGWLTAGNATDPCWVGVEVLEHHEPPVPDVPKHFLGKDRPRAATPCLHTDQVGDWIDANDRPWICKQAVRQHAPHIGWAHQIQLLAYDTPGPGRIMVDRIANTEDQVRAAGEQLGVFNMLADWLDKAGMPCPVYVTAHVVR